MSVDLGKYIKLPPSTPESRVAFRITNALISLDWRDRELLDRLYIKSESLEELLQELNREILNLVDHVQKIEDKLMRAAAVSDDQLFQFWTARHNEYVKSTTAEGGTRLELP